MWIGMLTRDVEDGGTHSSIVLTLGIDGVDHLNHTFANTDQKDQERGQANVYEVDLRGTNIEARALTDSSIRIGIRGDDAWRPEHLVMWGQRRGRPGRFDAEIIPLAIETDITKVLSTDSSEGPISLPLRLVSHGGSGTVIRRLLMLMVTQGTADDDSIFTDPNPVFGTENSLEIQMVSPSGLVALFEIANTTQDDLDSGVANLYTAPVIVPFAKRDLDEDALTLRIKGTDDWWPASFFLFGLDAPNGRPSALVPLSHLPQWPFGVMRADATTGAASVTLPLLRGNDVTTDDDVLVAMLRSIESNQNKVIRLLEQLVKRV